LGWGTSNQYKGKANLAASKDDAVVLWLGMEGCQMKTTIELAREAGNGDLFDAMQVAFLERFEALVRADERARLQPKKIKAVQKDEYCHGDERYYAND
jgi:hypothetical protein